MLKEFVARVALVLFIIGLTSEVAHDDGYAAAKQPPNPGAKNAAASAPSETAN